MMETLEFIIGIILILISTAVFIFSFFMDKFYKTVLIWIVTLIIMSGGFISIEYASKSFSNTPQAIDVYRGRTQLVLDYDTDCTYDSIVIWKGEDK